MVIRPMTSTTQRSTVPWQIAEAVLSFAGSAVAGTLWWAHRVHISLPCTRGGGCELVANSAYAQIAIVGVQIPVALLGLIAYLTAFLISMTKLMSDRPSSIRGLTVLLCALSGFGCAYSWYLQYIVAFKIGTFCVWCRSSAFIMTALFIVSAWELMVLASGDPPRPSVAAGSLGKEGG
jgi:uncharacterized membrane protein